MEDKSNRKSMDIIAEEKLKKWLKEIDAAEEKDTNVTDVKDTNITDVIKENSR